MPNEYGFQVTVAERATQAALMAERRAPSDADRPRPRPFPGPKAKALPGQQILGEDETPDEAA